jgi:hypothetical protein
MLEKIIKLLWEKFPLRDISVELSQYLYEDIYNHIVKEIGSCGVIGRPDFENSFEYSGFKFSKNDYLPYRSFQIECGSFVRSFVYNSELEITEVIEVV